MAKKRNISLSEEVATRTASLEKKIKTVEKKALSTVDISTVPDIIKKQLDIVTGESNFLENNKNITQLQLTKLLKSAKIIYSGAHKGIGMVCNASCLLINRCPLAIVNKAPHQIRINSKEECPIEDQLSEIKFNEYVESYADRSGKDADEIKKDIFIRTLLEELVQNHIIINRVQSALSEEGLLTEVATAINNSGDVASNLQASPLYTLLIQRQKRNDVILKQLLLTPEMELHKKFVQKMPTQGDKPSTYTKAREFLDMEKATTGNVFEVRQKDFIENPNKEV